MPQCKPISATCLFRSHDGREFGTLNGKQQLWFHASLCGWPREGKRLFWAFAAFSFFFITSVYSPFTIFRVLSGIDCMCTFAVVSAFLCRN
jgi:hypothetical protein